MGKIKNTCKKIFNFRTKPKVVVKTRGNLMFFEVKLPKKLEKDLEKEIEHLSGTLLIQS